MAIGKLLKSLVKPKTPASVNRFGQDLEHLTPDGELPWGWVYAHNDFVQETQEQFMFFQQRWVESKQDSPLVQMEALTHFTSYMKDLRTYCDNQGECYSYHITTWFDDSYLAERENELRYIKENIDALYLEYQTKKLISEQLPGIIKGNPGILQTDLYKRFPEEYKGHISSELYTMAHSGIITREKSGRTYSLRIAK